MILQNWEVLCFTAANSSHQPGIEPESTAWETVALLLLVYKERWKIDIQKKNYTTIILKPEEEDTFLNACHCWFFL